MPSQLHGKVALITGGAKRLGRAMALALAAQGVNIALHYRTSTAEAQQTAADIRAAGAEVRLIQGNMAQVSEVERVVDEAAAAWNRLDILINNAAIFFRSPLGTVTEAQWDALFSVNVKGPFFCAQRAAVPMQQTGNGIIINMVDTGVYIAWKDYLPYLMGKAGIELLTYGLAKALSPDIRVNGIAPGPVLLEAGLTEAQYEHFRQTTLLKRLGGPDVLAETALYLVQNEFVTGVVIPVDGGQRWK